MNGPQHYKAGEASLRHLPNLQGEHAVTEAVAALAHFTAANVALTVVLAEAGGDMPIDGSAEWIEATE